MDLSIIIVYYKNIEELAKNILSLSPACADLSYETIVVDNSPTQELQETILAGAEGLTLLRAGRNLGLARATNMAIAEAKGRHYLFLNPDIIATKDSVKRLVEYAEGHSGAGIVASKLVNPDGSLQLSCRRFYTLSHILVRRTPLRYLLSAEAINSHHLMKDYDHSTPRNVDWVLGSCLLIREKAVQEVGSMDGDFFLYFEDVDWCYRMHKADWDVVYYPHSVMIHSHKRDSASPGFGRQKRAHLASFIRFHKKHGWSLLLRK